MEGGDKLGAGVHFQGVRSHGMRAAPKDRKVWEAGCVCAYTFFFFFNFSPLFWYLGKFKSIVTKGSSSG